MQSSTYTAGPEQIDGRRYIRERHIDVTGAVHEVEYLAAPGTDYAAIMTARAVQIDAQLAEQEAAQLLGQD